MGEVVRFGVGEVVRFGTFGVGEVVRLMWAKW